MHFRIRSGVSFFIVLSWAKLLFIHMFHYEYISLQLLFSMCDMFKSSFLCCDRLGLLDHNVVNMMCMYAGDVRSVGTRQGKGLFGYGCGEDEEKK